jgi:hypothetical protein
VALGVGSILRNTMNSAVNFLRLDSHCGSLKTQVPGTLIEPVRFMLRDADSWGPDRVQP